MPFGDFFDFGSGDFVLEAIDVESIVETTGVEYLSDGLTDSVTTTYFVSPEIVTAFGYEQVGNFAGDAAYNDFFNAGGYLDNPAAVSDFTYNDFFNNSGFIDGADVARTPGFGEQIVKIATQVQTDFSGFVKGSQEALRAYQKVAPLVNIVTAALKIPNPINQLIQPFQQVVGIAGAVSDTAGSVRAVGNAVSAASTVSSGGTGYKPVTGGPPVVDSVAPRTVEEIAAQADADVSVGQIVTSANVPADAPFRELSDAETRRLISQTIDRRLINSAADSGLPSQETYDTALITQRELTPESIRLTQERDGITIKLGANEQRISELEVELTDPTLSQRARDEIALELINLQADNGVLAQEQADVEQNLLQTNQQLLSAEKIILTVNDTAVKNPAAVPGASGQPLLLTNVVQNVAKDVQEASTGFIKGAEEASVFLRKTAPLVNAVSAALKVPNPFATIDPLLRTAVSVAQATGEVASLANARPSVSNPGAVTAAGQLSYDTAIIYRGELEQDEQRLRNEREEILLKLVANDEAIKNLESQLNNPDLTQAERDEIARELIVLQAENGELEVAQAQVIGNLQETRQQLANADAVITQTNASAVTGAAPVPSAPGVQYESIYNPTTGTYSIYDRVTGETAVTGLTEQQARQQLTQLGVAAAAIALNTTPGAINAAVAAVSQSGLSAAEIEARQGLFSADVVTQQNAVTAGLTAAARDQQTIRSLRNNKAQSSDWRVRLRLAPGSNYLYNDPTGAGVMAALRVTDGVIFPYTPSIETAYKANYTPYDLTHSNYRGYFYQNSYVDAINVRATFTAQDTNEADYLLAVIHFFRSATKMFYGSTDTQRGAPPPLVYLNGYGDFQFSEHPCVISQFNYTLPPDVDYIRSQNWLNNSTNLQLARLRNPIANNPLAYSVNRILNSGLFPGAKDFRPPITNNLADGEPTYVPTKMEISISLLPIQSRQQVSQNFSVSGFAKGNLLKGGYW